MVVLNSQSVSNKRPPPYVQQILGEVDEGEQAVSEQHESPSAGAAWPDLQNPALTWSKLLNPQGLACVKYSQMTAVVNSPPLSPTGDTNTGCKYLKGQTCVGEKVGQLNRILR